MIQIKDSIRIIEEVNHSSGVLDLLRSAANVDDKTFNDKYISPLIHIANWVQELPACKLHHFEVGGAVRFAIHSGFAAVRLSESFIFTPSDKSEFRFQLEKEFRYASYLAAIFSTVAYPFSYLQVVNQDGEIWSKNTQLNQFASDGYDLQWVVNSQLDTKKGYFYASRIMPVDLLDGFNQIVVDELMKALSPDVVPSGQETSMQKTVRQSIQKVIELEKKRISQQFVESSIQPYQAEDIVIAEKQTQENGASEKKSDNLSDSAPINSMPAIETADSTFDVFKVLDKGVAEVLRLFREDLRSGAASVEKIKPSDLGLILPSSLLSKYGLPLTRIEGELRKKSMVVKKEGQIYHLNKELGAWLLNNVVNNAPDLFEVPNG